MNLNFISKTAAKLFPDVDSKAFIERVLAAPEVRKFIEEDETARLAERKAKLSEIPAAHARLDKSLDAAAKRFAAAERAEREMEQRLNEARAEKAVALAERMSLEMQLANVLSRVEMEMLHTADTRIAAALDLLRNFRVNGLNRAFKHGVIATGANKVRTWSNGAECMAASQVIDAAIDSCLAMQLEALSAEAVEKRLATLFAKVDAVLVPLDLRGPRIEGGEVVSRPFNLPVTEQQGTAA